MWCKKCLLIKVQQFLTTIQQQWHGPVDSVETVDRPVSQAFRASSHLHYRHWTTHTEPLIHHHGPQHWQSGHCPQHEPLCQEDGVCCAGTTCHQGICTRAGAEGGKTRTYFLLMIYRNVFFLCLKDHYLIWQFGLQNIQTCVLHTDDCTISYNHLHTWHHMTMQPNWFRPADKQSPLQTIATWRTHLTENF